MSQPILTFSTAKSDQTDAQVHLLPCRIHHDGNVDPIEPYWSPAVKQDGTNTAYLRGRKLHGKTVRLPQGYYGSVVEKGETTREIPQDEDMKDAEVEELPEAVEVAPLSGKAQFDSFVVWGHGSTADSSEDPYVRSMEEWVSFAEQIHSHAPPPPDN